jgi:NAD-dependent dihydropyrimidine dehydrogenase PreA subunit
MKRKMICIDEDKCNGCGNCITACAEGALQLVDGKARVVKERFCDGFGDCIGECPTGALTIEEREVEEEFDVEAVKEHLRKTRGEDAVRRMVAANLAHDRGEHPAPKPVARPAAGHGGGGGCPGARMRMPSAEGQRPAAAAAAATGAGPARVIPSELDQWPIQLHLVQAGAPFFRNRELVVLSTCSPIASADVHWRFVRGRGVVVACPKLDRTEGYVEKLAGILAEPTIPRVLVVRMEVPCCGGLTSIVRRAVQETGRSDLVAEEVTVSLGGEVMGTSRL